MKKMMMIWWKRWMQWEASPTKSRNTGDATEILWLWTSGRLPKFDCTSTADTIPSPVPLLSVSNEYPVILPEPLLSCRRTHMSLDAWYRHWRGGQGAGVTENSAWKGNGKWAKWRRTQKNICVLVSCASSNFASVARNSVHKPWSSSYWVDAVVTKRVVRSPSHINGLALMAFARLHSPLVPRAMELFAALAAKLSTHSLQL